MANMRIDVVQSDERTQTSARVLLQTLEHYEDEWEIHYHSITRPDLPGDNVWMNRVELAGLTVKTLSTFLRLYLKTDVLIVNKILKEGLFSRLFGTALNEHLFLTLDTTVFSAMDGYYASRPEQTYLLFEKADLVYATSQAIADEARKHAPQERVAYIPPSVDTESFHPQADVPGHLEDDKLVLGWIGDPDYQPENLRELARCTQGLPADEIKLRLLLGGGSLPSDVRRALEEAGIELDFIDYVPIEEVPGILNSIDIGLAPLADNEFQRAKSCQKIREYMACGLPVIGSDIGENPSLVTEDVGILASNPKEWADAVARLSDPKTRKAMGRRGRKRAQEKYSIPVVAAQLRDEIEALL